MSAEWTELQALLDEFVANPAAGECETKVCEALKGSYAGTDFGDFLLYWWSLVSDVGDGGTLFECRELAGKISFARQLWPTEDTLSEVAELSSASI